VARKVKWHHNGHVSLMSAYRLSALSEWVCEQFLNGTSTHIRLFSALPWYGRFTQKRGYNQGYL